MKTRYKLIALDMDGTLLTSDKTIAPESLRDIGWAAGQGAQAVYCTGRGVPELREYFSQTPMMRYAVCNSGAVIYDCAEGRGIAGSVIAPECVRPILETAAGLGAMIHFLTDGESIVSAADITHMADFNMGVYQPMFLAVARQVPDMKAEAARQDGIAKINLYFPSPELRLRAFEALKELPLKLTFQEIASLEMTARGVDKGSGLRLLARRLGVDMQDTVGIGDSDNDLEMLDAVGCPIAMGNASAAVRARCAFVTDDNDHNGVGLAIRRALSDDTMG